MTLTLIRPVPHKHTYPNREEWAKNRRTLYADMCENLVSCNIADYTSPAELNHLVTALKEMWCDEGRKMRDAKTKAGALTQQPGETHTTYGRRWLAMSDTERALVSPVQNSQFRRQDINRAIREIQKQSFYFYAAPSCAGVLIAPFVTRYRAAQKAAEEELARKVAMTPIDDAAWRQELRRRAYLDGETDVDPWNKQ